METTNLKTSPQKNHAKEPKEILLVDDDKDLIEALEDKLKSVGFVIHKASDGEEGLKKALEIHPNLIILDIVMPKTDGISMLRALREDGWGCNASVLMLTNINENDKLAQALEIGIDEYLVKTETKLSEIVDKAERIIGTSV